MKDFAEFLPELVAIRRDIHAHPELGLEEHRTSALVARKLEDLGFEVARGIGRTGLVGTLRRPGSNRTVGLRADMDALPMTEQTGLPHASTQPGRMHACGHDGHTAMLLGAAWRLANDPDFKGTAHLIFQPAEENEGGGEMMVKDGLFQRFPCDRIYAMHNRPGAPVGHVQLRAGATSAAIDAVTVTVRGRGGHGARPEETIDPIVAGAAIVMALQSIVGRNVSPHAPAVVTVGAFQSGTVCNIIPDTARLEISMRSTDPTLRAELRERVQRICRSQAESFGASVQFQWLTGYPATINDPEATQDAARAARDLFGPEAVSEMAHPMMGSEDFSFLLEQVPGAYVNIGNGDSSGLHTTTYDFNDALLTPGSAYFHRLVRQFCDS
ncbi:MAG: M20 aminoacylase family protein [Paracoccus sp. (in: a-proteobacteria)]|uniref:M20 aminoacylase family protein n=1 Tax=Paracoccus sp. TaxID=267 RepID=UPI0039E55087